MSRERYLYWKFENLYSSQEIEDINKQIDQSIVPKALDVPAEDVVKTADVKVIDSSKISLLDRMCENIIEANKNNFGYNIYYEKHLMNYNIYSAQNKARYDYHLDMIFFNPASDIKLTAILNLSTEPYEGGTLYLNTGNECSIPELKKPGNMIIFPSFILHKVKPVTKGARKTLSAWVGGPKFQ